MGQVTRHLSILATAIVTACAVGSAAPGPDPAAAELRFPSVTPGTASPNEEVAAAELLAEARREFEALSFETASAAARRIVDQYPTAPGSAEALWILSRATLEVGNPVEAADAAERLLVVLPEDHPVASPTTVLLGHALFEAERYADALLVYLEVAPPHSDSLLTRIADAAEKADRPQLEDILPKVAPDDPRRGPLLAELSLVYALSGNWDEASRRAEEAVALGVEGRPAEIASAVLAEDLTGFTSASLILGAVLPMTGSPTNRTYAELFLEGVQIAVDLARREGLSPQLVIEDNAGTPTGTEQAVEALEGQGVLAILGPLIDSNVSVASRSRSRSLAVLSPTGRTVHEDERGVFSLAAVDPGAAKTLATTLSNLGYDEAVLIHSQASDQTEEALTFEQTFAESGGRVLERIDYAPGTTYFEDAMLRTERLQTRLMVLAVPEADIEILAPQISFFGLDTLEIDVAGTAAWTSPRVLQSVANRHTDRVVSVASFPPGAESTLADDFIQAYEERFRKTLRSPIPALGFDLARMVIQAYGSGVRTSGDLLGSLEVLEHFPGVTGTYGMARGQIVREYFPVKIFERGLLPADSVIPRPERVTIPGRN